MENWIPHSFNRPKLLIVDDQPLNIRILHQLFHNHCDVFMATDGEQAIAICQAQLPDLVLLDVVMDGIDGHEVCKQLKQDALTKAIPIIFITAQREEAAEVIGLELGAVDFITKPFNPTIVSARVRTHLTLKAQSDYLRSLALIDGLTGVANRRKFDDDLLAAWRQGCRTQTPVSLVLLDVDYFKPFNDYYGHQAGDMCLKAIAAAMSDAVRRPEDLVARYGGEEFACILPNTDLSGSLKIAENIQKRVRALGIEHASSPVAPTVSVSMGIALVLPDFDTRPDALITLADSNLYLAKNYGRDRIFPLLS